MSWIDTLLGHRHHTPQPDPEGALLRVNDLHLRRGDFRLHIDEWAVMPGTVVGLVGPNGAGKTTLMESLVGLHPLKAGAARVVGLDPARSGAQIRASVSLASSTGPESALKVGAALSEVARYYPSWDADLTRQLLERFSLNVDKRISRLSTGEKARFRLVLALAFRPQSVFLDEPALGLDLTQRRALFETVLEIARDPERAVVISSHQLEDLERLADQLFVIADGRCVKQGHIDTLIDEGQTLEEALLKWGAA